ncbi:MAG: amino acid ABC transporter ATP-binding protein, partial [Lachnospiraceae bacterium]|nr:amino acid ABC transporter ATP-binding protein [Lachnospiraceae bacterium]
TTKNKKEKLELRQHTEMVFQQFNLFKNKDALSNVMEGLTVVKKIPKEEARKKALEEIEKVGMSDRLYHYPKHLSGGQQQRVAIARALALEPELLLMDEPTSALDPELVNEVLLTIKRVAKEGNTILLVTHEMNFVKSVANRIIFLENGKIVADGTPQEIFENPTNERLKTFLSNINMLESADNYII